MENDEALKHRNIPGYNFKKISDISQTQENLNIDTDENILNEELVKITITLVREWPIYKIY